MAIATKPKLQKHDKKRKALHHRQSQHYLKSYLPYLPMLLVVVVGLAVNVLWTPRAAVSGISNNPLAVAIPQAAISPTTDQLSRMQFLTGSSATWLMPAVSATAFIILTLWLAHYGLRLRKVLVRGEAFIANHPLLDFVVVSLVVIGWVLTQPV